MTAPPLKVALVAASAGGIIGSLVRAGLTDWFDVGTGFPWSVFAINVAGSALLATLPALAAVRRTPWLGVFLGTGVLGGFTTMSAASAETVGLFERDRPALAISYAVATLLVALVAVVLVDRLTSPEERAAAEDASVDA